MAGALVAAIAAAGLAGAGPAAATHREGDPAADRAGARPAAVVPGGPSAAAVVPNGPSAGAIRAGAASADITPPVGTPMFAYTARSGLANPPRALQILADPDESLYAKTFEPSKGIHTRVRARAIVIERGPTKLALVQADLGGLPYDLVQEVARRLAGTGISADRMLISATHTHSSTGPIWPATSMGYGLLGGDLFDPRVFELTAAGIAEAIRTADAHLEAARVGVGSAELRGASRNRNFEPFRRNGDVPRDEAAAREDSIDPLVTVVRVDAADGRPIGAWSNFAIHPTSFGDGNLLFSGDNAATAERLAEAGMAREAPVPLAAGRPPVNVWTNGNEGDIAPDGDPEVPDGEPLEYVPTDAAKANLAGTRVGRGILAAWRDAGERMSGDVAIAARRTFLAFDGTRAAGEPVGPLEALGAGGIVAPDGFCAPFDGMAGPGQGMKFPLIAGIGLVPSIVPVSVWRIGPLGIAAYPSEITKQMGRRIRNELAGEAGGAVERFVIAGLTNGYVSYTATPEEYDACHYEGSFTLFGRRQGARLLDAARRLVSPLLSGGPAPAGAPEPPRAGFGLRPLPAPQPSPAAGEVVREPAADVPRLGRATFSWRGGDPVDDAPRGATFVRLQREARGRWVTVGTDDGPADTTAWNDGAGTWTETWQFGPCDPVGRYRFLVTGRASRAPGAMAEPYEVASRPFALHRRDDLEAIDAVVGGGTLRARFRYPDPGPALLALPRRVRSGTARATIQTPRGARREVRLGLDERRLGFEAAVPPGSRVESVHVTDGCANTGPR